MYYIDDKQWINEHIKVSDNLFNNIDSQLLPLFINYAKKSDDYMTIRCVDMAKKSIDIIVNRYDTIRKAKEEYFRRVGSGSYNHWIFDGEVLCDQKTFDYYQIEDQDQIIVAVRCG